MILYYVYVNVQRKEVIGLFDKAKFRAALILKGMTMEQLAAALDINPATLSRKVNGVTEFTHLEMKRLRSVLSLSVQQFEEIFFPDDYT